MNRRKVLIVDDETIIRMDLREMLQEYGFGEIWEAKNGEEAVELAHKHRPDLILMDVKMPQLDGIKAAGIIRKFSDASIVLLTAYSDRNLVEEACGANVTAYLVKPVSEDSLFPAIEVALSQREQFRRLKEEIGGLSRKFEARKTVERAKGKIMQQYAFSEEEAHRWLQQESMRRRIPMVELADRVLAGE